MKYFILFGLLSWYLFCLSAVSLEQEQRLQKELNSKSWMFKTNKKTSHLVRNMQTGMNAAIPDQEEACTKELSKVITTSAACFGAIWL